jgi:hypothetical protein
MNYNNSNSISVPRTQCAVMLLPCYAHVLFSKFSALVACSCSIGSIYYSTTGARQHVLLCNIIYAYSIQLHSKQDVNRVLVKPVVAPPEDDGHLSRVQLATEAWSR